MQISRNEMVTAAKARHSDAVIACGADSREASLAVAIVKGLENATTHPVENIVRGAVGAFASHLVDLEKGIRVGGGNSTARLSEALHAFFVEHDMESPGSESVAAWADYADIVVPVPTEAEDGEAEDGDDLSFGDDEAAEAEAPESPEAEAATDTAEVDDDEMPF